MDTLLLKIQDYWNVHQLTNQQGLFWNDPGLGILSWVIIGVALFIIAICLILWVIKLIIKESIKGAKAIVKFVWKYCIWWWFKWAILIAIVCFILILIIQGFGIWLGDISNFWWVFKGIK